MELQLKGMAGTLAGQVIVADEARPLTFGSADENAIVLAGKGLARRHAVMLADRSGWLLYSLISRGFKFNGQRVGSARLHPGDSFAFGEHSFVVEPAGAPARPAPRPAHEAPRPQPAAQVATPAREAIRPQPARPARVAPRPQDDRTVLYGVADLALVPRAYLHAIAGELVGQSFPLYQDTTVTIGRDEASDIGLRSRKVSRNHARMLVAADGVVLVDDESVNGTLVNGRPIGEQRLRSGDEVVVGGQGFRFEELPAVVEAAPGATLAHGASFAQAAEPQPVSLGVRCPGRCGKVYPLGQEHCPIDGTLLVNGRTALF